MANLYAIILSMAVQKAAKARPKVSNKTQSAKSHATVLETSEKLSPEKRESIFSRFLSKKYVISFLILLVIAAALFLSRSLFIAATVNGQPIYRLSIIQELERQGGKQTIDQEVTRLLVLQEAQKKNLTVSEDEINKQIKTIEADLSQQGQSLDRVLELQGLNRASLRERIKERKLLEKLLAKDVAVSDKEVNEYIEKNKDTFPENTKPEEIKDNVKKQLEQQKFTQKAETYLADLRKKANIVSFVDYLKE